MFADTCMEQANTNSEPARLPLFRAEALAARQQGTQGEILLIRPLSLAFLSWLGVALAGLAVGFLFLGHYTPSQRIEGKITQAAEGNSAEAVFEVPESKLQSLRPGQNLRVRCTGCVRPLARIVKVLPTSLQSANPSAISSTLTITLLLEQQLPAGTRVQAEIQLERKPLIAWLLEKPGT